MKKHTYRINKEIYADTVIEMNPYNVDFKGEELRIHYCYMGRDRPVEKTVTFDKLDDGWLCRCGMKIPKLKTIITMIELRILAGVHIVKEWYPPLPDDDGCMYYHYPLSEYK